MAAATVKAVVVGVDTYRWHETYGDSTSQILDADYGTEITVAEKEYERGEKMGALAKAGSKAAKKAVKAAKGTDDVSGAAAADESDDEE